MAVFSRSYQAYEGRRTSQRWRFLILSRYALEGWLRSRAFLGWLAIAMIPVLVGASFIYLSHNSAARTLIGLVKLGEWGKVDARFFVEAVSSQCFFGFVLAAWVGPSLVGRDLANGALPLYLSRPLTRFEYILGKLTVLVGFTSAVTWGVGLLLYALNSVLAADGWWLAHWRIAVGLVVGGLVWSSVVSLFALALSSWIRWRLLASSMLIGIYFVSAGLAEVLVTTLHTPWGRLLNLAQDFRMIWSQLFDAKQPASTVPTSAAWAMVALLAAASMVILNRKLRAREIVG
jgi:ABC-type transport system involved in multi-copper enzyme maturation permease subunit